RQRRPDGRALAAVLGAVISTPTGGAAAAGPDHPNSYSVLAWQTENGLPQNSVQAIVQTRDGHLWLGTKEGLARFNGAEFTIFNASNVPEMTNPSITALVEGPDASLWIGTD